MTRRIIAFMMLCGSSAYLDAVSYIWDGTNGTPDFLLTNAANWTPNFVPNSSIDGIMENTGSTVPQAESPGPSFFARTIIFSSAPNAQAYTFILNNGVGNNFVQFGDGTAGGVTNNSTNQQLFTVAGVTKPKLTFAPGASSNTVAVSSPGAQPVLYQIGDGITSAVLEFQGNSAGSGYVNLENLANLNVILPGTTVQIADLRGLAGSIVILAANSSLQFGLGIGVLPGTSTFAGKIQDVTTGGNIIKEGSGTEIFTGANSYSGTTTINTGTLWADGNTVLSVNSPVTINNSGILKNSGQNSIPALNSTSPTAVVDLDTSIFPNFLEVNIPSGSCTYAGLITDGGILQKSGNGTLILSGVSSTYTGGTVLLGGTVQIAGDGSLGAPIGQVTVNNQSTLQAGAPNITSSRVLFLNDTLTIDTQGFTMTWSGTDSITGGLGSLEKTGPGTLILTSNNNYGGNTILDQGTLQIASDLSIGLGTDVIVNGTATLQAAPASSITSSRQIDLNNLTSALTIDTNGTNMEWDGIITGPGSLTKGGNGTLLLTAANNYSGGTTVSMGNLQGDTVSLQGNILDNATLTFDIPAGPSQTFNGVVSGPGIINKIDSGTLVFNTNQSGFSGTTNINGGTLSLTNTLGGTVNVNSGTTFADNGTVLHDVNVNSGGTMIGTGTVGRNLTVFSGGTISPGNSNIGTIHVLGNYIQQPGGTYIWEGLATGPTDTIDVTGQAMLSGNLQVMFTGDCKINTPYPILFANEGVLGTFTNVINLPPSPNQYVTSKIFYAPYEVYFACQTIFGQLSCGTNGTAVANQIDGIVNPDAEQLILIDELIALTPDEVCAALNDMAGTQYTYLIQMARYSNERLKNGIYNAIRNSLLPCWSPVCCERVETWFQADMGKFNSNGNSNAKGLTGTNWDVAIGAHFPVCNMLLLGIAANYERDYITFNQGGKTTRQTGQVAGYVVGRSDSSYIFGEVIYGTTTGRYNRPIRIGSLENTAKSTPKSSQALVYLEAGMDFPFQCPFDFLVQPFIGLEYNHYDQKKIKESGASLLDLTIKKNNRVSFDTLLGVHINSAIECVEIGVDLAWQYRYDNPTQKTKNTFEDFGSEINVIGCEFGRNGARGNLRASYDISQTFNIYADLNGESWEKWNSYGFDFGLNGRW